VSWGEGGEQGKCGLRQPQPHNKSTAQKALSGLNGFVILSSKQIIFLSVPFNFAL
jgi:hypothetical protein